MVYERKVEFIYIEPEGRCRIEGLNAHFAMSAEQLYFVSSFSLTVSR